MISQKELKQILDYDKETGIFTNKIYRKGINGVGDIAGSNLYGYVRITINRKSYPAHCLAWLYVYGYFPDHKDRIKY